MSSVLYRKLIKINFITYHDRHQSLAGCLHIFCLNLRAHMFCINLKYLHWKISISCQKYHPVSALFLYFLANPFRSSHHMHAYQIVSDQIRVDIEITLQIKCPVRVVKISPCHYCLHATKTRVFDHFFVIQHVTAGPSAYV